MKAQNERIIPSQVMVDRSIPLNLRSAPTNAHHVAAAVLLYHRAGRRRGIFVYYGTSAGFRSSVGECLCGAFCAKSIAGIGKIGMNGFANVFLEVLQWDWLELLTVVFYT
jgi:rhodanese-related sulfurtransferase